MKLEKAKEIISFIREHGDDCEISESVMMEAYDTVIDALKDELKIKTTQHEKTFFCLIEAIEERDEARKYAVEMAEMVNDCIENSEDPESYLSKKYLKYATTVIKEYREEQL